MPADAVMISNLVIIGGHETFVSGLRPEGHPDEAGGLESLRAAVTASGVFILSAMGIAIVDV